MQCLASCMKLYRCKMQQFIRRWYLHYLRNFHYQINANIEDGKIKYRQVQNYVDKGETKNLPILNAF